MVWMGEEGGFCNENVVVMDGQSNLVVAFRCAKHQAQAGGHCPDQLQPYARFQPSVLPTFLQALPKPFLSHSVVVGDSPPNIQLLLPGDHMDHWTCRPALDGSDTGPALPICVLRMDGGEQCMSGPALPAQLPADGTLLLLIEPPKSDDRSTEGEKQNADVLHQTIPHWSPPPSRIFLQMPVPQRAAGADGKKPFQLDLLD